MTKTLVVALAAAVLAVLLPVQAQALENEDLLALVAMPLAVAAVAEATDVPVSDLVDVVTLLNDAAVPPAQFLEVIRYAPVALVVETERPRFVEFVRTQEASGVRGPALVTAIQEEIVYYGAPRVDLVVERPRVIDIDDDFVPAPVRTRLVEARSGHPHGGPPGQLRKERGLKTGAEVVHRDLVRYVDDDGRVVERRRPTRIVVHEKKDDDGHRITQGNRGKGKGQGKAKGHDKGKGQGKGKGKGKG